MKHIYCISGFGADGRVFSKLNFANTDVHFIPWFNPLKKETIEAYAKRMSAQIHHKDPILFGLSFGGIMCIEIAKIISTGKVIIISSIKSFHEMPLWMKLTGKLQLDKIVPLKTFKFIEPLENFNLGIENNEELKLVSEYRKTIGQQYTNWATHQILNWKNEWQPKTMVHIHGGKDHIFPLKNIKADYVIPDGGHFMIMNRSQKVNNILEEILN
ncbi:alpha/beta hydrolase [Ginsengibacter hankyongi]|uniref:Alpha/beta hydrolase n=1 Tax=Ginsengibacter hankyongi TaxID=2607284 RepID=A0A5J5IB43_9BACT|nr:alpha/beta hydrolase [Ginsengibacter hankyongi]KAA9034635.1 alpha/beta hydrolase [Ginsengibacter hankyongi]